MYLFGYSVGPFFIASLSETFGRRPLFIAGLASFTAFMAATGASPNYGALLAFRFLSGVAGAVPMTKFVAFPKFHSKLSLIYLATRS